MAKAPEKEIEFHPDAMQRFERAVKRQQKVRRSTVWQRKNCQSKEAEARVSKLLPPC
jgi:hypothetical protein